MIIQITIDTKTLKELVLKDIEAKLGHQPFDKEEVKILVKTKNYKAEWEAGEFKAVLVTEI